jgi:hypothetical protein
VAQIVVPAARSGPEEALSGAEAEDCPAVA